MEQYQTTHTQAAVASELGALLKRHGANVEIVDSLRTLPPDAIGEKASELLELLGARPHLIALVASYRETLDDEAMLELLRVARPAGPASAITGPMTARWRH